MKDTIEIIFQHGWGFDSAAWKAWRAIISDQREFNIRVKVSERGYFAATAQSPQFDERSSCKVIVAHSGGLHFLHSDQLKQADLLVIISSFATFHSGENLQVRRSRRALRLMIEKLEHSPAEVLDDFYANCYHPLLTNQLLLGRALPPDELNVSALREDLELIDSCRLDDNALSSVKRALILHGDKDKVVSPTQAVALQKILRNSFLIMYEGVGHALPFTHAAPCWLAVSNALKSTRTVAPVN